MTLIATTTVEIDININPTAGDKVKPKGALQQLKEWQENYILLPKLSFLSSFLWFCEQVQ